jgi:DNA-directed RNA polymerase sigma subunit (sigma70/sigma32)
MQAAFSDDPAEWWNRLTPEQQASVRRALGKDEDWYPSSTDTVERQFDETRRRIREIEQRALAKYRKGGEDEPI